MPAQAMIASGATQVYSYRFDWAQEPTVMGSDLSKLVGAAHGLEIPFVFGHFDLGRAGERFFSAETKPDREALSAAMMAYWSTFAATGAPGRGGGETLPEWPAWDASSPEKPKEMVLDVPSGGGLRMINDVQSVERVQAELAADARLPDPVDRCALTRRLVAFHWFTEVQLKAFCAAEQTEH